MPPTVTETNEDYRGDWEAAADGGYFDLSSWGVVSIVGPDAHDYVQRMSTLDVPKADRVHMHHGAFLTGRAGVIAMGWLRKREDGFLFLVPPGLAPTAAAHLEQFHFAEKLTVTDVSAAWGVAALWAATGRLPEGISKDTEPLRIHEVGPGWSWRDDVRPLLTWVTMERARLPTFLGSLGLPRLGGRLFEFFRIDAAVPQAGLEIGPGDIVLEGNFERAVARNKGCYPGQEVVERIYTYGQVNRKLLPMELEGNGVFPAPPFSLRLEGDDKPVAQLVSLAPRPDDERRAVGLAFVRRGHWDHTGPFLADGGVRATLRPAGHAG